MKTCDLLCFTESTHRSVIEDMLLAGTATNGIALVSCLEYNVVVDKTARLDAYRTPPPST